MVGQPVSEPQRPELVIGYERFDFRNDSGNATYSLQLLRTLQLHHPQWHFVVLTRLRERFPPPKWLIEASNCSLRSGMLHPLALGPIFKRWVIWRNTRWVQKVAKQWDLMHITNPLEYVFGLPIPVVVTIHDLIPLEYPQWVSPPATAFYRTVVPAIVSDADWILANSFYTAERILHYMPAAEGKLSVTPLAAAPTFFPRQVPNTYLAQYGIRRPFVLYVGSIQHPRKNVVGLLRAFAEIHSHFPDLQLVLVGRLSDPRERKKILATIAELRLREKVRILEGKTAEEIANFYAAATVFCYPSFVEGFGLPVVEAMQSGCPVITSNRTSLPEVAGEAAVLVDPYNVAELAEALAAVVESETLQAELRRKGLAQAAKFSWEETAQLTAKSYLQLVERRGARHSRQQVRVAVEKEVK